MNRILRGMIICLIIVGAVFPTPFFASNMLSMDRAKEIFVIACANFKSFNDDALAQDWNIPTDVQSQFTQYCEGLEQSGELTPNRFKGIRHILGAYPEFRSELVGFSLEMAGIIPSDGEGTVDDQELSQVDPDLCSRIEVIYQPFRDGVSQQASELMSYYATCDGKQLAEIPQDIKKDMSAVLSDLELVSQLSDVQQDTLVFSTELVSEQDIVDYVFELFEVIRLEGNELERDYLVEEAKKAIDSLDGDLRLYLMSRLRGVQAHWSEDSDDWHREVLYLMQGLSRSVTQSFKQSQEVLLSDEVLVKTIDSEHLNTTAVVQVNDHDVVQHVSAIVSILNDKQIPTGRMFVRGATAKNHQFVYDLRIEDAKRNPMLWGQLKGRNSERACGYLKPVDSSIEGSDEPTHFGVMSSSMFHIYRIESSAIVADLTTGKRYDVNDTSCQITAR